MSEYFERTVSRMGMTDSGAMAWAKGEARLGLKNSLFICTNGNMTQYVDPEEGEKFHKYIKDLTDEEFDKICEEFFEAIENKNLEDMHVGLAVFSELDEYDLGSNYIRRRLLRVRKSTENEAYNFKLDGGKTFIIYKGEIYSLEKK